MTTWKCNLDGICELDENGIYSTQEQCINDGCIKQPTVQDCGGDGQCPCPTESNLPTDVAKIAKSMGMSDACVKETETLTTNITNSTVAGGLFGVAANVFTLSELDDKMMEAGCGSFFNHARDILMNTNNIACVLNQNKTESTQVVNTNATISLKTLPLSDFESTEFTKALDRYITLTSQTKNAEIMKNIARDYRKMVNLRYDRSITITGSTVSNIINGRVTSSIDASAASSQESVASFKNTMQAAAEHKLESDLGTRANSESVRQLINDRIQDQVSNITSTMNEIISRSNANVTTSGNVIMEVAGPIIINNTTLGNNLTVDVVTDSITNAAIVQGSSIITDLMLEANTITDTSTSSAGLDDLQRELGIANANAIAATGGIFSGIVDSIGGVFGTIFGSVFGTIAFIVIGFLIVAFIAFKFLKGKSNKPKPTYRL